MTGQLLTVCCLSFLKLRFIIIQRRLELNIYHLPGPVKTTLIANYTLNQC